MTDEDQKDMITQKAEFDAFEKLAERWRIMRNVAVVDDEYPRVRHEWESALATFCEAMQANGRGPNGRPAQPKQAKHELTIAADLNELATKVHKLNHKWWHNAAGVRLERNRGELIALIHSEASELLEHERKSTMDDHLPHRRGGEVECADIVIRTLDYAAGFGYDIGGALIEKLAYNTKRADHSHEQRARNDGKKF